MARTTEEIQQSIIDAKNNETELTALNSPSQTAIWRLWTFIVAQTIQFFEQLIDVSIQEMEQIARDSIAGTAEWLQKRVLEFQYSATNPQVVSVVDGRISYPIIDASLRIVTRAAVKEQANGRVLVKAAKGETTLSPLGPDEQTALRGYLDKISFVGMPVDLVSLEADRLRFEGTIFFSGEFVQSQVFDAVKESISNYLKDISVGNFNGLVVREELINAIQLTPGVVGVDTLNVKLNGRPFQSVLGDVNNVNIVREYETDAGYIIEEDTPGNTFDDTITLILQ